MLAPIRTVAPEELPVSLEEMRARLNVDSTDKDSVLNSLIGAKTDDLDGWTGILGRALVTQTWQQSFGAFCALRLPLAPVSSVTSVTYYDGSNAQQTLSTSVYQLVADGRGPKLILKPDQSWPGTYRREDAVTVTFVAGYGAPVSVPEGIKSIIALSVQIEFDPLEPAEIDVFQKAIDRLVAKYRRDMI